MQKNVINALKASSRVAGDVMKYLQALTINPNQFLSLDIHQQYSRFCTLFADMYNLEICITKDGYKILHGTIVVKEEHIGYNPVDRLEAAVANTIKYAENPF